MVKEIEETDIPWISVDSMATVAAAVDFFIDNP